MALQSLTALLDRNHADYTVIPHEPAVTAQEVAAATHVRGREMAKTLVVKIDGRLALAVLPATEVVHTEALRKALGAREVALAGEEDFFDCFPECEVGAMPPFGDLFGMEVFVTPKLALDEKICFNAGNHREVIRMPYAEFARLAHPVTAAF